MIIIDFKHELIRSYIRFLLEDVRVSPLQDYTVSILGDKIHLVVGEEKKIPRYIARILASSNIVKILDDSSTKEIIGRLIHLAQSVNRPYIYEIPETYYIQLIEALRTIDSPNRDTLLSEFRGFLKGRLAKVIHRVYTRSTNNLERLEALFVEIILMLMEDFISSLVDSGLEIIKKISSGLEEKTD